MNFVRIDNFLTSLQGLILTLFAFDINSKWICNTFLKVLPQNIEVFCKKWSFQTLVVAKGKKLAS